MILRLLRIVRNGTCLAAMLAMALPSASAQDFVATGPGAGPNGIPDFTDENGIGGTVSTITITDNDSLIEDLAVCIDGLSHTWAGDLIARITRRDLDGTNPTTATLFERIGRGDFGGQGDASNFDGDYEIASTGASLWSESALGSSGGGTQGTTDDDFFIRPDTYANVNRSGFDTNTNPGVPSPSSLAAIFGGLSTSGIWEIRLTDHNKSDTGTFTGTGLKFTTTAVPEPGTYGLMAVASIGGLFYARRKKKQSAIEAS